MWREISKIWSIFLFVTASPSICVLQRYKVQRNRNTHFILLLRIFRQHMSRSKQTHDTCMPSKKYKRIKDVSLIKTFASTDCYKPPTICIPNVEYVKDLYLFVISLQCVIFVSQSQHVVKGLGFLIHLKSSGFLIQTQPASCFSLIHTLYSRPWNEIRGSRSNVEFSQRFSRVSYCEKWLQRAARELERRNAWNWASNTIPAFYGRRSVRGVNGERVNRLANCMS